MVRGAAGPGSDLDLLVDSPGSPSFEQYMDLKLALEDLLSVRVDQVTQRGLRAELRARIEEEAVPLVCLRSVARLGTVSSGYAAFLPESDALQRWSLC